VVKEEGARPKPAKLVCPLPENGETKLCPGWADPNEGAPNGFEDAVIFEPKAGGWPKVELLLVGLEFVDIERKVGEILLSGRF
jgi:hypothetical protein